MSALCAVCGAKRNHSSHLRAVAGKAYHAYEDASKVGIKPVSDGRAAYQRSEAHRSAMELSAGATDCWPAAYGAPGECYGKITPSHILSAGGGHGGLKVADTYPAPPACVWHNDAMEQDVEVRAWAERTYFTHGNRQYPFKVSREWLQAEKDGVRQ